MYLKDKSRKSIDGFTPEQRFFIGFAQVWKNNARPEYLRQQVMTDPHSPGKFRVLGPLSNMPQFYSAFGIKQGDKMFIAETDRAKIW
jgi:putative endopeptidase